MVETKDIAQLKALIVDQHTLIGQLQAENAELRARLSKNSTNSHKPPSSEGLAKKPAIQPALPKQAGKKQGGQVGHKGDTLHISQSPDQIIVQQASHCQHCGLALQGEGQLITRRQVFDLPKPRLEVVEYQLRAHTCCCGCVTQGQFPAHVKAPVQYGPRLKATSLVLNVDYRIPLQKLSDLWQQWVGHAVNTATLLSAQAQIHQ